MIAQRVNEILGNEWSPDMNVSVVLAICIFIRLSDGVHLASVR